MNTFIDGHLEHRLAVLRGFRNRTQSESPDCHRAMKDGALVTVRSLLDILGVSLNSRNESDLTNPTQKPSFKAPVIGSEWNIQISEGDYRASGHLFIFR